MNGWYAMKRGWLDHEAFKPSGPWSKAEAWVYLVESAAYQPTSIDIGGRPYTVPRGACCFSLRFLAGKWLWSVKAVQTFLKTLERHGAIAVSVAKTGNGTKTKRTQITLCNYEKYQGVGNKTETREKQKSDKEEQGNNISVPSERDDAASDPVSFSVQKIVWGTVPRFLTAHGIPDRDARSITGKWLKASSPSQLLEAVDFAEKSGTKDPIPYITETLKGKLNAKSTKGQDRLNAFIAGARGSS